MERPNDIPEGVWNIAFHHMDDYSLISAFYTDEDETKVRTCVSRAILAERERCAKIADYFCESAYSEGMSEDVVMARSYTAGDIAAAIRKGE